MLDLTELFASETRLYELAWRDADLDLPVEAWWGREVLSSGYELYVDLLSTDAFIELKRMLGQAVTLWSTVADGSKVGRTGLVRAAAKLGADGGFARYRLTVVPWTWLTSRGRHNRVFQERTVQDIVEHVFADYADVAAWHWSDDVAAFLADTRPRSYCVQYRESDYAFVSRLLAEEGLGWCIEENDSAPTGHRMRIFADSRDLPEDSQSASGIGGAGIRYHRADSQEEQDAVVAFGAHRRFGIGLSTALSYDYKNKRAVTVTVPTAQAYGSANAPAIEQYSYDGLYAWADSREAERYQRLAMEAHEARFKTYLGRSSVRSFRPGFGFNLTEVSSEALGQDEEHSFNLVDVIEAGINNLSARPMAEVAQGMIAQVDPDTTGEILVPIAAPASPPPELLKLAGTRGYGNTFEAVRTSIPWRPVLIDGTGQRLNPRPTVPGPMNAIVVGPNNETRPSGADELWCDALGRIKVRFLWQMAERPDDASSCWLRVVQRQAGNGMGWQWLPRIGQEVLVSFLDNDIDRPIVLGALYNGRGEGGITPTPGGAEAHPADAAVFDAAADQRPRAQGNLTDGNSPTWHGGAEASHKHAAALSGFRTKEFGGQGYNQLVFDDTDRQQRIQLKTTQHATELNLGHLVHQADNYRGSFRGTGVELRTDAWGSLRGGRGVIMTTWPQAPADPAGDMAPGLALLKQATTLADTLSKAAHVHQTVQLSPSIGSTSGSQSAIDDKAAPLKALTTVASGMVAKKNMDQAYNDADGKNTQVSQDAVPHLTDPAIVQTAKAGLGIIAGQNLQVASGETITLMSGEATNLAIAGKARIHTGQAIGLVAGAIQPGPDNTSIKLIAAKDDIDMQAQSDALKWQSKGDMTMVSANADIDFAAAKKIVIAVAGGASITIDGGINVMAPGTITVHASSKSFSGPASMHFDAPTFMQPDGYHVQPVLHWEGRNDPVVNRRFRATLEDGRVVEGVTDAQGHAQIIETTHFQITRFEVLPDKS